MSKRGSKYLRTLFVQAAHILLMLPENRKKFSFGPWLEQAAARLHKNKLAVALANKLARIAWNVPWHGKNLTHIEMKLWPYVQQQPTKFAIETAMERMNLRTGSLLTHGGVCQPF